MLRAADITVCDTCSSFLEAYSVFLVLSHIRAAYSSSLGQGGGKGVDHAVGPDRWFPVRQYFMFCVIVFCVVCLVLLPPE